MGRGARCSRSPGRSNQLSRRDADGQASHRTAHDRRARASADRHRQVDCSANPLWRRRTYLPTLSTTARRAQRRDSRHRGDLVADRNSTLPDVLQIRAKARPELRVSQAVLDGGAQITDLATAVVTDARERQHVDWLVREQARDAVGELDLSSCTALRTLELGEDVRRQYVAANDGEIRRRIGGLRFLDDPRDALSTAGFLLDRDNAVTTGLIGGYGLDTEHAGAVFLEMFAHLLEAADLAVNEIVGQVHEERLV